MAETPESHSLDEDHKNNIALNIALSYEYTEKSIKEVQDASNYLSTGQKKRRETCKSSEEKGLIKSNYTQIEPYESD